MKNQKKAFTLTELLVVVIVIGVLSAAVLPKFSKIIETRKTTEAEELMASIRTEQEKRCALDKQYLTNLNEMMDVVKKKETKNYLLSLEGTGVIASSKGSYSYHLQMPSYADGRICCDDCGNLNKNYPSCEALKSEPDYQPSPESCAGAESEPEPEVKVCVGAATQSCGCQGKGTQTRTCNTTTGTWGAWSACSVDESCECSGEKKDRQACTAGDTCGFETRSATCNTDTGEWVYGSWNTSSCIARPAPETRDCPEDYTGTQTRSAVCKDGVWLWGNWTGSCTWDFECEAGEEEFDDSYDADRKHGGFCVGCESEWYRMCLPNGTWGAWCCRRYEVGFCGDGDAVACSFNAGGSGEWYIEEKDYTFQAGERDQSCNDAYSGTICSSAGDALSLCSRNGAGFVCAGNFSSPTGSNARKVCFGTGYYCRKAK